MILFGICDSGQADIFFLRRGQSWPLGRIVINILTKCFHSSFMFKYVEVIFEMSKRKIFRFFPHIHTMYAIFFIKWLLTSEVKLWTPTHPNNPWYLTQLFSIKFSMFSKIQDPKQRAQWNPILSFNDWNFGLNFSLQFVSTYINDLVMN